MRYSSITASRNPDPSPVSSNASGITNAKDLLHSFTAMSIHSTQKDTGTLMTNTKAKTLKRSASLEEALLPPPKRQKLTEYGETKKAAVIKRPTIDSVALDAEISSISACIDSMQEAKANARSTYNYLRIHLSTLQTCLYDAYERRGNTADDDVYHIFMPFQQRMPELAVHATSALEIAEHMEEV